jgi:hypothetical protein
MQKGTKTVYQQTAAEKGETITVLQSDDAEGQLGPYVIIFNPSAWEGLNFSPKMLWMGVLNGDLNSDMPNNSGYKVSNSCYFLTMGNCLKYK